MLSVVTDFVAVIYFWEQGALKGGAELWLTTNNFTNSNDLNAGILGEMLKKYNIGRCVPLSVHFDTALEN